jgi:hypothetical protein
MTDTERPYPAEVIAMGSQFPGTKPLPVPAICPTCHRWSFIREGYDQCATCVHRLSGIVQNKNRRYSPKPWNSMKRSK